MRARCVPPRWLPWALAVLCCPMPGRALDIEVDSDTALRVYEVRSPAADVFWERRRLIQRLELRLVQELEEAPADAASPLRLQARVDLRLNQEFGNLCLIEEEGTCFAVTDSGMRTAHVPLASEGGIDLPMASIEMVDDAHGLELAAGRQLHWDPIGMLRFDGGSARIEPVDWFAAQAYGGALVRSSSVAGNDAFVPAGVLHLDLPELDQQAAEHIEPAVTTAAFGSGLWFGPDDLVRVGAHFRELREEGDLVERSVAATVGSAYLRPLRIDGHAVLDPVSTRVVNAVMAARARVGAFAPHAEVQRRVPRFDRGSIWAYFDVAPVSEASVGSDVVVIRGAQWSAPVLQLGASLRARRTELGTDEDDDLGTRGHVDFELARHRVVLSGFAWDGGLGGVWGADLQSDYRATRALTVSPRVSAFRLADGSGPRGERVGMVEALQLAVLASAHTDVGAEVVSTLR